MGDVQATHVFMFSRCEVRLDWSVTSHDPHSHMGHLLKSCGRSCKGVYEWKLPSFILLASFNLFLSLIITTFDLNMFSRHGPETHSNFLRIKLTQGNINKTTEINWSRSSESTVCHMGRKASKKEVREEWRGARDMSVMLPEKTCDSEEKARVYRWLGRSLDTVKWFVCFSREILG